MKEKTFPDSKITEENSIKNYIRFFRYDRCSHRLIYRYEIYHNSPPLCRVALLSCYSAFPPSKLPLKSNQFHRVL